MWVLQFQAAVRRSSVPDLIAHTSDLDAAREQWGSPHAGATDGDVWRDGTPEVLVLLPARGGSIVAYLSETFDGWCAYRITLEGPL